jgi:hypothetical protein
MVTEKELKVLQVVETVGPVLPTEISKNVGMDSFLASAVLATLLKNGAVKRSIRKIGSSLIYYVDGQEEKVRSRLLKELNELEKKALERVKQLRVAFDEELYPQERLMLNELKDFAAPIQVRLDDGREIHCWKYYEVSDDELKQIVNSKVGVKKEVPLPVEQPAVLEQPVEIPAQPVEIPVQEVALKPQRVKPRVSKDKLLKEVTEYLESVKAKIIEIGTKKSEVSGLALINSSVGQQEFLIKAFGKKSLGESDLSKIYLESSQHKKPVLLLVKSEPNKKIAEYAKKHLGSLLKIIKI